MQASEGWLVPSKEELSAFAEELGITKSNYTNKGLSDRYWSSSQSSINGTWIANFGVGSMHGNLVNDVTYVRLSATF